MIVPLVLQVKYTFKVDTRRNHWIDAGLWGGHQQGNAGAVSGTWAVTLPDDTNPNRSAQITMIPTAVVIHQCHHITQLEVVELGFFQRFSISRLDVQRTAFTGQPRAR